MSIEPIWRQFPRSTSVGGINLHGQSLNDCLILQKKSQYFWPIRLSKNVTFAFHNQIENKGQGSIEEFGMNR